MKRYAVAAAAIAVVALLSVLLARYAPWAIPTRNDLAPARAIDDGGFGNGLHARILAGSGRIGDADGNATAASFVMPSQVAIEPNGTVDVVDGAGQRIRAVTRDGSVTTLAGGGELGASGQWVDGGYANGPALLARFDHPDGIAVMRDGSLLISDRGNACLRRLARGEVTTYAGAAGERVARDGPRDVARFISPRELAVDRDGTIYVADWGAGVRRIAPDGSVSTVRIAGVTIDRPTGVAIGHSGPYAALFVADARGIVRAVFPALRGERTDSFPTGTDAPGTISSDVPLGVPHTIAALGVGDVVFTDLRDSTVKYLRIAGVLRYLGRTPAEDAMLTGGGPAFSESAPQYDAPMGIAVDGDGSIVVADSGNRRLVHLDPLDVKTLVTERDFASLRFPPGSYRVALVGSSFTWWGSTFDASISGRLVARLATVPALRATPPAIRYFQTNLRGEFDLMDNLLSLGTTDAVVFMLAPTDPYGLEMGDETKWGPYVRARVEKTVAALRAARVPLLLVVTPSSQTVSPLESAALFQGQERDEGSDYDREYRRMLRTIAGIDVPVLDLYPAFRAEIARPAHHPLFNTANSHYSPYGRDFVAAAIFDELLRRRPWKARP